MLVDQMATAISGAPLRVLDDLSRDIWKALSAGLLSDEDAQRLAEAIHAKRTRARSEAASGAARAGSGSSRPWSYFPPKRRPQRSPDRQRSKHRKRFLAFSGPLPTHLAAHFTVGELAALRIIADEVRNQCECRLTIPEVAARSGTSESTVRRALREASRLGLITVEERRIPYRPNLSNVVRIISREWLAQLRRRGEGVKRERPRKQGFPERRTCLPPSPMNPDPHQLFTAATRLNR